MEILLYRLGSGGPTRAPCTAGAPHTQLGRPILNRGAPHSIGTPHTGLGRPTLGCGIAPSETRAGVRAEITAAAAVEAAAQAQQLWWRLGPRRLISATFVLRPTCWSA